MSAAAEPKPLDFSLKSSPKKEEELVGMHSGCSSLTSPALSQSPQSSPHSSQSPSSTTLLQPTPQSAALAEALKLFSAAPGAASFGLRHPMPFSSFPPTSAIDFQSALANAWLSGSPSSFGSPGGPESAFFPGLGRKRAASPSPSLGDTPSPGKKAGVVVPDEKKDALYWERRRKNNEAAKRSRDSRRRKEEEEKDAIWRTFEVALRAALLEQENMKLRAQVAVLKTETAKLQLMLFSGAANSAALRLPHQDNFKMGLENSHHTH